MLYSDGMTRLTHSLCDIIECVSYTDCQVLGTDKNLVSLPSFGITKKTCYSSTCLRFVSPLDYARLHITWRLTICYNVTVTSDIVSCVSCK